MSLARWFQHGQAWHAFDETAAERHAVCGLTLLGEPPEPVAATEDQPYPPNPCRRCLLAVAMDDVEEESLEHAKARGYFPAPD